MGGRETLVDTDRAVSTEAPAGPTPPPPRRGGGGRWHRRRPTAPAVALAVLFVVVGTVVALVRLRTSPLYPLFNDVNSDVYVFQLVGNSWRYGYVPYRDVFDVKGPFLYLLFGGFAWIRPWSMAPALVFLAVLASCSAWLAYLIARLHGLGRGVAALVSATGCLLIYLGVADVNSSFTCEEIAVPGVLLMLWLVLRWLRTGVEVPAAWWVVDGMVFAALFWTKYQVIAPWAAVFVGLVVLTISGRLTPRQLRRVAGWNLLGLVVGTAAILAAYADVLPDLAEAYFLGKRGSIDLETELPEQAAWLVRTVTENTAASLLLAGSLVVFVAYWIRSRSAAGLVTSVGLLLSMWASAVVVRHPNHLFVPLTFCVVALAQLLAAAVARGRIWLGMTAVATVVVTGLTISAPLAESREKLGLLERPKRMTCYDLVTGTRDTSRAQVTTVFARAAGDAPILSLGTLFAARSSFVSRQPVRKPFEFVDHSWAWTVGATQIQTGYLERRTFDYVWVHVDGRDPDRTSTREIERTDLAQSRLRPEQAVALLRNYRPVLRCNNEILLRST